MKSNLFARSLRLLAALGWGTASLLLAQSTNLINDGTSLDHLTALANRHGTAGATLGLTPGEGALAAAQSGAITDMALNGVWFDDRRFPDTNRFAVLADVRPETSYPEHLAGITAWLDPVAGRGLVFRIRPGELQGAFELAVVDFTATTPDANVTAAGLWQLDGAPAQFLYGSAWGASTGLDPAQFATVRLDFAPATAADRTLVPDATARVTGRVYQGGDTPVGDELQLLTSLPVPATHRFGYHACWDTVLAPGSTIGHLKNLRFIGTLGTVAPPVTPATLAGPRVPAAGRFEFTALNLTGTTWRIESSADLQTWSPVETGAVTGATQTFNVPQSGAHRHFRLVSLP